MSLQMVARYGQTFFLLVASVAILCGDHGNCEWQADSWKICISFMFDDLATTTPAADTSTANRWVTTVDHTMLLPWRSYISVSQQACQAQGCIFYMSSKLYLYIGWMEFRDIIGTCGWLWITIIVCDSFNCLMDCWVPFLESSCSYGYIS